MEIWGHCGTCDRWFYCPTNDGYANDENAWICPVCRAQPTAIENRARPEVTTPRRQQGIER